MRIIILIIFFGLEVSAQNIIPPGPSNEIDLTRDTIDGSDLSWAEFGAVVKHDKNYTFITPESGSIGVVKIKRADIKETKPGEIVMVEFKNGLLSRVKPINQ